MSIERGLLIVVKDPQTLFMPNGIQCLLQKESFGTNLVLKSGKRVLFYFEYKYTCTCTQKSAIH